MVPIIVGGVALLLSSAVVIDQTGDTVEQTGNASLKVAVLAAVCIGGYIIYTKSKKGS
ncbi:hypothetical protein [Aliivibrio fischeri]|uniref:hypothetical protein n=1 Tax=Aliivibrio fischeri TaxID=668 RepID=UPI000AE307AF|nr:hypothetical protein [Aliivibrio fischeri]